MKVLYKKGKRKTFIDLANGHDYEKLEQNNGIIHKISIYTGIV